MDLTLFNAEDCILSIDLFTFLMGVALKFRCGFWRFCAAFGMEWIVKDSTKLADFLNEETLNFSQNCIFHAFLTELHFSCISWSSISTYDKVALLIFLSKLDLERFNRI